MVLFQAEIMIVQFLFLASCLQSVHGFRYPSCKVTGTIQPHCANTPLPATQLQRRSAFQGRNAAFQLKQSNFNPDDMFDASKEDFKVSSQIAKLNALAAKLRAEAAELEAEQKTAAAEALTAAFQTFDTDNDGKITVEELKEGLAIALYSSISEEQATKLMETFDKSGDGALQLNEFQGIESFRRRLDELLREEKQSAVEARAAAATAKAKAQQAEAISELINNRPPTVQDRLVSVLPYLLPLLDVLPYGTNFVVSRHLEYNPGYEIAFFIFNLFQAIPFSGLIAFFFLNVLTNNLRVNRLVRFNIQQAILLDIALILPGFVGPLISVTAQQFGYTFPPEVGAMASTITFFTFLAAFIYSTVSSLTGLEPDKLPFISAQVKKRVPTTEEFKSMFDSEGNFKPLKEMQMKEEEMKKEEKLKKKKGNSKLPEKTKTDVDENGDSGSSDDSK